MNFLLRIFEVPSVAIATRDKSGRATWRENSTTCWFCFSASSGLDRGTPC